MSRSNYTNPTEQKARQLWAGYAKKNGQRFWKEYEALLARTKNSARRKISAAHIGYAKTKPQANTAKNKPVNNFWRYGWVLLIGALLLFTLFDLSEVSRNERILHIPPSSGRRTYKQETVVRIQQGEVSSNLSHALLAGSLIKVLNLEKRHRTQLPTTISKLENLEYLYLQFNDLTSLPASIGKLEKLKVIDLWGNSLTSLPASIGQLKNLEKLHLWHNKLTSLPAEITHLRNLKQLYLLNNQLTQLPWMIGELSNLEELELDNNKLKELPPAISALNNLKKLSLKGNPISKTELNKIKKWLPNCHVIY